MAEVVGVVSAGIGLAAFALQVADKIERLKDLRQFNKGQAEEELEFLIQRLEVLRANLLSFETVQRSSAVDRAVSNCQLAYSSVDDILQRATRKLTRSNHGRWRTGSHSGGIKEELKQAGQKVNSVTIDLTCSWSVVIIPLAWCSLPDGQAVPSLVAQAHVQSPRFIDTDALIGSNLVDGPLLANSHNNQLSVATSGPLSDSSSDSVGAVVQISRSVLPRQRSADCALKHCHCSCHLIRRTSGRLWTIEYTPISMSSIACNNLHCTATRYRWSVQFSLTKYGIPFRMHSALEFVLGSGRYALRPALAIERVVKYTSPGFEALWCFRKGLISLSETMERFRELKRSDPSLRQHVHPGGRNYVEVGIA